MGRFEINSRKPSPFEVALASSCESTPFEAFCQRRCRGRFQPRSALAWGANARPPSPSYDQLRLFELIAFYVHKGL